MKLSPIKIPESYNYIGIYLTYNCNISCSYCITKFHGLNAMTPSLSTSSWIRALNRIESRADLPLTLQGGEPTLHPGFYPIVSSLPDGQVDILTNGMFDAKEFMKKLPPSKFNRKAKYASIRFSLHYTTDEDKLLLNLIALKAWEFNIGVWAVDHPLMKYKIERFRNRCRRVGIDFRTKEFLGRFNNKLYGNYKYPEGLNGKRRIALCRPSELIVAPDGNFYRCHSDLYAGRNPLGNIMDEEVNLPEKYMKCDYFGQCNPCDLKITYNRFQEKDHCSVDINEEPK